MFVSNFTRDLQIEQAQKYTRTQLGISKQSLYNIKEQIINKWIAKSFSKAVIYCGIESQHHFFNPRSSYWTS